MHGLVGLVRALRIAEIRTQVAGDIVEIRTFRNEANGARQGTRSIQRTLRTAQHLDALDVIEWHGKENRRFTEICRYWTHRYVLVDGAGRATTRSVRPETAKHKVIVACPSRRTLINVSEARHELAYVFERIDVTQLISRHDADVVGHILHRFDAPLRADDDLLERPSAWRRNRGRSAGPLLRSNSRAGENQRSSGVHESRPAALFQDAAYGEPKLRHTTLCSFHSPPSSHDCYFGARPPPLTIRSAIAGFDWLHCTRSSEIPHPAWDFSV